MKNSITKEVGAPSVEEAVVSTVVPVEGAESNVDITAPKTVSTEFVMPDKFNGKTSEEIAKAYMELEKMKSTQEPVKDESIEPTTDSTEKLELDLTGEADKDKELPTEEPASTEEDIVEELAKTHDLTPYFDEFTTTGDVTQESKLKLATELGIPEEMISEYVEMSKHKQTTIRSQVMDVAGGEEAYDNKTSWARRNLSEGALNSYNEAVDSGDIDRTILAVRALNNAYETSNGVKPNAPLRGTTSISAESANVFRDKSEWMNAIADPRYSKSPAYRNEVALKKGRSTI